MKLLLYCIIDLYIINRFMSIKLKLQYDPFYSKKPGSMAILNVHVEEPGKDPLQSKRLVQLQKNEDNRIIMLDTNLEEDKAKLQNIINIQNNLISQFTNIIIIQSNTLDKLKNIIERYKNND